MHSDRIGLVIIFENAQGVAADVPLDADCIGGGRDHAVRLRARERGVCLPGTWEEIGIAFFVHFRFNQFLTVICERSPCLMVQKNTVFFAGLLLPDCNVLLHSAVQIDIIVSQIQNIADAQRGVQSNDNDGVIAQVYSFIQIIVLKIQ